MAAILCVGMAGSGKTTFMQRLNSDLHAAKTPPYILNLDPAVVELPYGPNIDIRDSINYTKVMEEYNLGPNGAIMTSLNLFSTKIDQVLGLVEKRSASHEHVLVDTPGQIECFVWSASGQIITDALASALPTVLAYIVDIPRCTSPATFMSNMLYACSILYKTKLPMIIVFNKIDIEDSGFAKEWMTDFESFQRSLNLNDDENGSGYMGSLMSSLSLVLEEFYNTLDVVSVSAMTGKGIPEFFEAVERKKKEYADEYLAERERVHKLKEKREAERKAKDLAAVLKDNSESVPQGSLSDFESEEEDTESEIEEPQGQSVQDRYRQALAESQDPNELAALLRGL